MSMDESGHWAFWNSYQKKSSSLSSTRPGKLTGCYGKSPFIVNFTMKNGGSVHSFL